MRRESDRRYVVATGVAIALVLACYAVNFYLRLHYDVSTRPEDWAALGDYFGGVLGPILTFISIVLLIKSLRLQNDANDSLRADLKNSEKTEQLRSFEALFFGMIEAQKDLFKNLEMDLDTGGESRQGLRGVDAVFWLENRAEQLREVSEHSMDADIVSAMRQIIDDVDTRDQIFGIVRAFYIVVRLIIERLSMERGFSDEERKSHFLALVNFTDYAHLRLVLMCVQFCDYAPARYLKGSGEFERALDDVGLGFNIY